jgi:hypothetical protein
MELKRVTLKSALIGLAALAVLAWAVAGVYADHAPVIDDDRQHFQTTPTSVPTGTPTPIPPTLNELSSYTITVLGVVAIAMVFSDQIARLVYYVVWRARQE